MKCLPESPVPLDVVKAKLNQMKRELETPDPSQSFLAAINPEMFQDFMKKNIKAAESLCRPRINA